MLDLQSYMMYELFMSRRRERDEVAAPVEKTRSVRFPVVAWALASLGSKMVQSGRKLKDRYEPRTHQRPQTSN